MNAEKKSFVMYFDSRGELEKLSDEQRGMVLSALFDFAERCAREETDTERVLDGFPGMEPAARTACGFMFETIRRDTRKWQERKERYSTQRREARKTDDLSRYVKELKR